VFVALALIFILIFGERPVLGYVLGVLAAGALETVLTVSVGGSVGKLATGLRVRELDHGPAVSWTTAAHRSFAIAGLVGSGFGALALISSVLVSANWRSFVDRRSRTFVVLKEVATVAHQELEGFEARARPAPATPFGPTASVEARWQARLERLSGAPLLVLALVPLLWVTQPLAQPTASVLLASAAFILVFIIDETWRVAARGGTEGHRRNGLTVIDLRTGRAPSAFRSLVRAVVLAPLLFVPPLPLLLVLWTYNSASRRGPHDRMAGTAVIEAVP
jgi:hypothetical protein